MPFLRRRSDQPAYRQILHEFSRSLVLIVDEAELHQVVAAKLQELFRVRSVTIFLRDGDGSPFEVVAARGDETERIKSSAFAADSRLARWLKVNESPLVLAEDPGVVAFLGEMERSTLEQLNVAACVPMIAMNRLTGFITFGAANEGFGLSLNEVERELLTSLVSQAALAFENAALLREQKSRLKRMYQAERLATAGELAAGAAHEIRNPLTGIRSAIQYIRGDYPQGSDRASLIDDLLNEVDRIDEIVSGLLSFARPQEVRFEVVDLGELLRQTSALLINRVRSQRVLLNMDVPEEIRLNADPNLLKQVILNLLLNALQAMPDGGSLGVVAQTRGGVVWVRVTDTGSGIAPEHLERVFDPFFSTKREGTGLGLSICYGVVERHGGEISVESDFGRGTEVTVRLPQRQVR